MTACFVHRGQKTGGTFVNSSHWLVKVRLGLPLKMRSMVMRFVCWAQKRSSKMCVDTHKRKSFERGRPKDPYMWVIIDFTMKVDAWTRVAASEATETVVVIVRGGDFKPQKNMPFICSTGWPWIWCNIPCFLKWPGLFKCYPRLSGCICEWQRCSHWNTAEYWLLTLWMDEQKKA